MVQFRPVDVAKKEAKIQRRRKDDEKTENNLFQIHFFSLFAVDREIQRISTGDGAGAVPRRVLSAWVSRR